MMTRGTYSVNRQINFRILILRSSLCDYSDTYILVKGVISVNNTSGAGADANNTIKKVIFNDCISKSTQVDNAEDIDIVMLMYNLIEYSDNYSKTSGSLWQYCKDIPAVNNNGNIVDFNGANATDSFNFKTKITGQTDNNGRIDNVEIMVPLKYLSNFWRTLEMPLINCEVELILNWSANCVIIYTDVANQVPTFTITETNLYVPVVTLSTQDNAKLLPQLKSGFKRTISWNKYLSKPKILAQNPNLNHLAEPSFQGVNWIFVLAFENDAQSTSNKRYYLPNVDIKDYNVTIDENIRKIATGHGDDYTTGCLLDYINFKNYYKMIALDLSKQQTLDADPKAIQQINFIANSDKAGNTRIYFIFEEAKETVLGFSQGTVKVL